MKASVINEFGKPLVWEDVETPVPDPDQVLVQVMACGIDGTDLKILDGFGYHPTLPAIIGHEIAGVVAEVGKNVTDFKPGNRVIVYNFTTCGKCLLCLTQREQICENLIAVVGVRPEGSGYAEYLTISPKQLVRLPDNISWPDAAVCCDAVITSVHSLDRARLKLGETVLVIGTGGVGSVTLQLTKIAGARVIAVNQSKDREQWSFDNSADEVLDSSKIDIPAAVRELTDGMGVDCVLDIVGNTSTMTDGINSLRHGGRLVIVGYTKEKYPLEGKYIAQNELEIIGTRCGRKQDLINSVKLMADGKIKSIVTEIYPMEKANEALTSLRSGKTLGRTVLMTPAGQQAMTDR